MIKNKKIENISEKASKLVQITSSSIQTQLTLKRNVAFE